ncbi:MAG: hypothetical protein R2862_12220 [Thermoanaerobaculia bacterium]
MRDVARGATTGSWSDGQLAAFLMGVAIRGLNHDETRELTAAMLESGERWKLSGEFPVLADKHSTGGVGDKSSLILPLLAAVGVPVVMLTGCRPRHTAGTADKLESIPGIQQSLDRERARAPLAKCGMALCIATAGIAPADSTRSARCATNGDGRLRFLIVASILSKKRRPLRRSSSTSRSARPRSSRRWEQARELAGLLTAISAGAESERPLCSPT